MLRIHREGVSLDVGGCCESIERVCLLMCEFIRSIIFGEFTHHGREKPCRCSHMSA